MDGKLAVSHGMLEVPCMYGVTLSVVLTFSHIVQGNSTVDVLSQSAIISVAPPAAQPAAQPVVEESASERAKVRMYNLKPTYAYMSL